MEQNNLASERILVLDFGSQYAQLIARRVREQHVYGEIVRHDISAARVRELAPKGIILSGGPASVYADGAPHCDPAIFDLGIPILGICYGMQLACQAMGVQVKPGASREFGRAHLYVTSSDCLFKDLPLDTQVGMSHGDQVHEVSDDFKSLATTPTCPVAAV